MTRRPPLLLEELGPRVLPSVTPLLQASPIASHALRAVQEPPVHVLSGQGDGTFSAAPGSPGAGLTYRLYGEGQFAGLGEVGILGSVHSVGFHAHERAAGTLTLMNKNGSVTLALIGPDQPGFSALPMQFSYRVASATGAYAHLSDRGALSLLLAAQPGGPDAGDADALHGAFALAVALQGRPAAALDGALAGHFTPNVVIPEIGAKYSLTGSGTLAGLGAVSVTGFLQATGMAHRGHATGELTITGANGTVTLDLRGPIQGAFAPVPGHFNFTVKSGTGAYANFHASGTIAAHGDAQDGTFTLAVLSS